MNLYLFLGDPLDKLLSALDAPWTTLTATGTNGPLSLEEERDGYFTIKVEGVPCAAVATRVEAVLLMAAAMYVYAQNRPAHLKNITLFIDIMVFGIAKPGRIPVRVRKVVAEL